MPVPDALPVSVLLLVRDEVADVRELLPTLTFAREVVVVWDTNGDAFARDAAAALGAQVHARALDGFGAQRAFALSQCAQEWVLWLDADERLEPGAAEAIAEHVKSAPCAPLAFLRRTWFLGERIRYCGWQGEVIVRLFRREGAAFDDARVHEKLLLPAGAGAAQRDARARIAHHSYRTWDDCVTKMHRYAQANAEQAFAQGRRANALDAWVRPPLRFVRQYVLQLGVLDGVRGWQVCWLAAAQVHEKYSRLRELGRQAAPGARGTR
jgi:hypothetical protein